MIEVFKTIFSGVWDLYQIEYPGFGFSIGSVVLGSLCVVLGLSVLGRIFGISFSVRDFGRVVGGNNKNIRISNDRKGDTR